MLQKRGVSLRIEDPFCLSDPLDFLNSSNGNLNRSQNSGYRLHFLEYLLENDICIWL